ncbi:MAG TPA: hypothetical protein VG456_00545 [Candidatus Sulfopaludibacter sp.]|jgi:hypothetical protein|nr:hypothetical protein [Candidatus Sulfopaludibacter sp.]
MKCIAICLLWASSATAQSALTDFIPPQTKVVIGFNLRNVIDAMFLPALKSDPNSMAAMLLAQNSFKGMDPLKDIDSVLIVATGQEQTPTGLAILRGRFDAKSIPGNAQYHGIPVMTAEKDPKSLTALLDGFTAIAGDIDQVHAAIDRMGKPHVLDPALAARITALSAKFDVWGMGDSAKGFPAAKGQPGGLDALDHFEFGATYRKDLTIEAEAHVRQGQDTKKMRESLSFLETMLNGKQTASNGTKFDLQSKNGTFKLSLFIPEAELKKAMAAQKTSLTTMAAPQPKPTRPEDVKIIKSPNGDTMQVILPGGH